MASGIPSLGLDSSTMDGTLDPATAGTAGPTTGPVQESPEEYAALEACERGDTSLLGALLASQEPRLRRIALARLDPRVAGRVGPDDVIQEAFLDVTRRMDEYLTQRRGAAEQRLPFFLWVRLMTQQVIARLHREHLGSLKRDAGREQRAASSSYASTTILLAHQLQSHLTSPTGALRRNERREAVEAALEGLSEVDREIILLRHYEELTNREIAGVLGLTESGAGMRHLRAISRLKEITADLGPVD